MEKFSPPGKVETKLMVQPDRVVIPPKGKLIIRRKRKKTRISFRHVGIYV